MADLPAFPGAEGYGANTTHGRGGRVIEVTNTDSDGPGSFREACESSGPRIIVFRIGGIIRLFDKAIRITEPHCYVAGQTATGDGICLRDAQFIISTHDVLVRHLRVRPADDPAGANPNGRTGIVIGRRGYGQYGPDSDPGDVYNIVVDHCSVSWSPDKNVAIWAHFSRGITFQWCLFSEALHDSVRTDREVYPGGHSCAFLVGDRSREVSLHHNLFCHNGWRHPEINSGSLGIDVVNNVIYDWGYGSGATIFSDCYTNDWGITANICHNYYRTGPTWDGSYEIHLKNFDPPAPPEEWRLFVEGNLGPHRTRPDQDEWDCVEGERHYRSMVRIPAPPVTTWPADEAYRLVPPRAGATAPRRDIVDERMLKDLRDGTGRVINFVSEVGGFPEYRSGEPPIDSDHDGIPDDWELAHGLDPNDPADANQLAPSSYTWIEEYLNQLAGPIHPPVTSNVVPRK
jgi:hypothetical protein